MKLIKTDQYLLLVDPDAEVKEEDYIYEYMKGSLKPISIVQCTEEDIISLKVGGLDTINVKIIAYLPLSPDTKELDLPLLPKFRAQEEQADFDKSYNAVFDFINAQVRNMHAIIEVVSLKEIYRTVQAKQFTLEDMEAAVGFAIALERFSDIKSKEQLDNEFKEFIKSLHPVECPKEFIPDYIHKETADVVDPYGNYTGGAVYALKTTTNSNNKEVLCGNYIY